MIFAFVIYSAKAQQNNFNAFPSFIKMTSFKNSQIPNCLNLLSSTSDPNVSGLRDIKLMKS